VNPRCVIVDDRPEFPKAARPLLERGGVAVVGVASTSAEAIEQVATLRPDVVLIDIDLDDDENGFELAARLAAQDELQPVSIIMISAGAPDDFVEPVALSPVLGFLPKLELSADAVRAFLADRRHGHACRHEALVFSTTEELVAATVPFIRHGLEAEEPVVVFTSAATWAPVCEALDDDARRLDFVDSAEWHREGPWRAGDKLIHFVHDRVARGASRVRAVGEPAWPTTSPAGVAEWKCFEAGISIEMAALPLSFICPYDARHLPEDIVADALRTHPLVRTGEGTRPSSNYTDPRAFIRDLEHQVYAPCANG
jgi:CheY-like chemotaxis protein